jgi:hypothetical protein
MTPGDVRNREVARDHMGLAEQLALQQVREDLA